MIKNVIFDIGNVLLDFNPRYLYKDIFSSDEEMESFLVGVYDYEWNLSINMGKPFHKAILEKQKEFPQYSSIIEAFYKDWNKTINGEIKEVVDVLKELKSKGYYLYALTNSSSEAYEDARDRFDFFNYFDGVVVSAYEKMVKPNPNIFMLICNRYNIIKEETVFIDDNEANVEAAKKLGFKTILFKYPELLHPKLKQLGLDL